MTDDEYFLRSAGITKRLEILNRQIDDHFGRFGNQGHQLVRPLIVRQAEIIKELLALDEEYLSDV